MSSAFWIAAYVLTGLVVATIVAYMLWRSTDEGEVPGPVATAGMAFVPAIPFWPMYALFGAMWLSGVLLDKAFKRLAPKDGDANG